MFCSLAFRTGGVDVSQVVCAVCWTVIASLMNTRLAARRIVLHLISSHLHSYSPACCTTFSANPRYCWRQASVINIQLETLWLGQGECRHTLGLFASQDPQSFAACAALFGHLSAVVITMFLFAWRLSPCPLVLFSPAGVSSAHPATAGTKTRSWAPEPLFRALVKVHDVQPCRAHLFQSAYGCWSLLCHTPHGVASHWAASSFGVVTVGATACNCCTVTVARILQTRLDCACVSCGVFLLL